MFTKIIISGIIVYLCLISGLLNHTLHQVGFEEKNICKAANVEKKKPKETGGVSSYDLQVPISDEFTSVDPTQGTTGIAKYIKTIYHYAIGVVGILAAIVLMFGGVLWLTAGGNPSRIENAKTWIGSSLAGLIIALASYGILYTLNPSLVNFHTKQLKMSPDFGVGQKYNCDWVIRENCGVIVGNKTQEMQNGDKYCGKKHNPIGAQTSDVLKTCCCSPGAKQPDKDCLPDGTVCNDDSIQNEPIPDCDECCNNWHQETIAKKCGLGSEGSECTNEDQCKEDLYCEDGGCYDGSEGDPCNSDDQCDAMNCIDDQGICSSDCSNCGDGAFNVCDETECLRLGNCEFTDTPGPGGECNSK